MLGYKQVHSLWQDQWHDMAYIGKSQKYMKKAEWDRVSLISMPTCTIRKPAYKHVYDLVFCIVKILRKKQPLSLLSISKSMSIQVDSKTLQQK